MTLLSVMAAIAVIWLHVNLTFFIYRPNYKWFSANVIEVIFYYAVSIFFMISGANLMDYRDRYSTKEFFKKRFVKTVVPFLAWSVIGLVYRIMTGMFAISELTPLVVYNIIMNTEAVDYYWFFLYLFAAYLTMPLFSAVAKERRKGVFTYLAIAGFALNSLGPFLINLSGLSIAWPVRLNVAGTALLYVLIGYLLDSNEISTRTECILYGVGLFGIALHFFGNMFASRAMGTFSDLFTGYWNPTCVMYSVGIFVLVKKRLGKVMSTGWGRVVRFIAPYTYGIYLVHFFVLDLLQWHIYPRLIPGFDGGWLSYRLIQPWIVLSISIGILFVMKKIPGIRKLVP